MVNNYLLVGGIPTPLKNMKVNGKDYPIYYGKKMFQTTNQYLLVLSRELMGMGEWGNGGMGEWGNGGMRLLLLVIMDHSLIPCV